MLVNSSVVLSCELGDQEKMEERKKRKGNQWQRKASANGGFLALRLFLITLSRVQWDISIHVGTVLLSNQCGVISANEDIYYFSVV